MRWQVTKEARPFLGKGSSIVYVSSVGGYNPGPPLGLYGVSKTALLGLTKLLAKELGPAGIRVNCLAPGVVRTRFSKVACSPWRRTNPSAMAHCSSLPYIAM